MVDIGDKFGVSVKVIIFIIWVSTAAIFLPEPIQKKALIFDFIDKYKVELPVVFWAGSFSLIKNSFKTFFQIKETLDSINHTEMLYLREFILQDALIIFIEEDLPPIINLQRKKVIDYAPSDSPFGYKPFEINPLFKPYITKKSFGLPENLSNISHEQRIKIIETRPKGILRSNDF